MDQDSQDSQATIKELTQEIENLKTEIEYWKDNLRAREESYFKLLAEIQQLSKHRRETLP